MKLESLIRREGGTIVVMDAPKRKYHFKPEGDAPERRASRSAPRISTSRATCSFLATA